MEWLRKIKAPTYNALPSPEKIVDEHGKESPVTSSSPTTSGRNSFDGLKTSTGGASSNSESSVSLDIDAKYAQIEFDEKIASLTESLDEKAKENMALVEQQNILKERIKDIEGKIQKEEEENSKITITSAHSEATNKEYRRRLDTMTESLIIQARENVELRENIYNAKVKLPSSVATEVAIKLIKENKGENEIVVLKAECLRLRQREESYKEAVATYEANIREISVKMQSSLAKEQERRKKAEADVQKLVQKILELESQLSEKGDENDDETTSSSSS